MIADMFPNNKLINRHGKEIMTRGNVQWRKAKLQFSAVDKEWLNSDHAPKMWKDSTPIERACEFIRKMQVKRHRALLTNNQDVKLTMNHSYNTAKRAITMCTSTYRNDYSFKELPNILNSVNDWTHRRSI
ncbi:89_t:CDS:2 [Gigaspora rosea]|nr:89_t:CDS:2 [Gigaspora rosea]